MRKPQYRDREDVKGIIERLCIQCKQWKPIDSFPISYGYSDSRRRGHCKQCQTIRLKESKRKCRARYFKQINSILSNLGCKDCSEDDWIVLEFDHVCGKKTNTISEMIGRCFAWSKIEEEMEKCEVRCANCHRRKTAKERNWYSSYEGL